MSSLYIFNSLSNPQSEQDTNTDVSFDGIVPTEIVRGDTTKKQIIFTFDAGSGTVSVVPILGALKKHNIKGTFFLTGKWALNNPSLTRMIVDDGHEVFNHTYDHPYLTSLKDEEITAQLVNMNEAFHNIVGSGTKPYFRPPYGDRNERVLRITAQAGYRSVYWTLDAHDWKESEGMTDNEVKERILTNLEPGMIILMHVGDNITGNILDDVLTKIKQLGYTAVSLTQGL